MIYKIKETDFRCSLKNRKNMWEFSKTRKEELVAENQNNINDLTKETLRYCFEQFAQIQIAPFFANIAHCVFSKCTIPFTEESIRCMNKDGPKRKKPVSHNVKKY